MNKLIKEPKKDLHYGYSYLPHVFRQARIQRSGMGVIQPPAGLAVLQDLLSATGPAIAQVISCTSLGDCC